MNYRKIYLIGEVGNGVQFWKVAFDDQSEHILRVVDGKDEDFYFHETADDRRDRENYEVQIAEYAAG